MLLNYLEYIFISIGILLCTALILNKTHFCKLTNNIQKSNCVAAIGGLLTFYVIFAMIIAFFIPNVYDKLVMFIFAISPFIIGKFATYEKEPLFTIIQFFCVLISVIYVIKLNL